MSRIEATDADRRMVEPVMEVAQTSDLPDWALTVLRGRAALLVAMARAEGYSSGYTAGWRDGRNDP